MRIFPGIAGLALFGLLCCIPATAQNREFRAERLVIDDNGNDGSINTMRIETPDSLSQNVVLTIPDPGSTTATFALGPTGAKSAWLLGGNGGINPLQNFLGTIDSAALQIQVQSSSGAILNGLTLNPNGSMQRDSGGDSRGNNAIDLQILRSLSTEVAAGDSSLILGGGNNGVAVGAVGGAIGGGFSNTLGSDGVKSVISGGENNVVNGAYSAITGGRNLTLDGDGSFGFHSGADAMSISDSNVAVFGNTDLWLANNNGTPGELRFYEAQSDSGTFPESGTNYTAFRAGGQSADITYRLPTSISPTATVKDGLLQLDTATGALSWLDQSVLGGTSWSLTGNSGTTPGTHFVGTTDSQSIRIQVREGGGTAVNSVILNSNGSLQRDAGGAARGANAIDLQIARSVSSQVAAAPYSHIGGGENNTITSSAHHSTIGAGGDNFIGSSAIYSSIRGGKENRIETNAGYSTIRGGALNVIDSGAHHSVILGGRENLIDTNAQYSVIGGGGENWVGQDASYGVISGGKQNRIDSGATHSVIRGGELNRIGDSASYAMIGGGRDNRIGSTAAFSTIGGGRSNLIESPTEVYSGLPQVSGTIGAGRENIIRADARYSTIHGGYSNLIDTNAWYATIAGGGLNTIDTGAGRSTIGGGYRNTLRGVGSAIPGGFGLTLEGDGSFGFLANDGTNNMTVSEPNIALFGNVNLWLANNNSTASQARFYDSGSQTIYTSFEAPPLSDTIEYILPAAKPTATGQILKVSAINNDRISLTWGVDSTVTARTDDVIPTSIGISDGSESLESRIRKLRAQLEARELLLQSGERELTEFRSVLDLLKKEEERLHVKGSRLQEHLKVEQAR